MNKRTSSIDQLAAVGATVRNGTTVGDNAELGAPREAENEREDSYSDAHLTIVKDGITEREPKMRTPAPT